MKNIFLKTICMTVLAILMLTVFAQIPLSAQNIVNEKQIERLLPKQLSGNPRTLEGTWDAQVRLFNCQNNQTIATFASIGSFNFGGTMIDSTSGIPQSLKTPGHGFWNHINGRSFRFKFKNFNFDASGNFTGWTVVTHTAEISVGGNSYTSTGIAEFFDQNGNPTFPFAGCSSTTATRFE